MTPFFSSHLARVKKFSLKHFDVVFCLDDASFLVVLSCLFVVEGAYFPFI